MTLIRKNVCFVCLRGSEANRSMGTWTLRSFLATGSGFRVYHSVLKGGGVQGVVGNVPTPHEPPKP